MNHTSTTYIDLLFSAIVELLYAESIMCASIFRQNRMVLPQSKCFYVCICNNIQPNAIQSFKGKMVAYKIVRVAECFCNIQYMSMEFKRLPV